MTSQSIFIPFNFENTWIFCKIYHIYCNFPLKIVENIGIDLIGIILYSSREHFFLSNFCFKLQKTLGIEFVEPLHYLMYKTK